MGPLHDVRKLNNCVSDLFTWCDVTETALKADRQHIYTEIKIHNTLKKKTEAIKKSEKRSAVADSHNSIMRQS